MMTTDRMICGTCKGKKTVTEASGKPALCPKCAGRGVLLSEDELKESIGGRKKTLLKG